MNIKPNSTNFDDEKMFITDDLPVAVSNISLYKRPTGDYVIRKFGKEFPDLYVGVRFLAKELEEIQVRSIVIREGGNGFVSTLIAAALPKIKMRISLWSAEYSLLERNVEANVEQWIEISVEKDIGSEADVGILVHESYQSQESVVEEVINLLNSSTRGVLYMISHKSKGSETVTERIRKITGISGEVVSRGKGGARVVKFLSLGKKVNLSSTHSGYSTVVLGRAIRLQTGLDAFSKDNVDDGSAMLINFLTSIKIQPCDIWDLGCGYGYIGIAASFIYPNSKILLSDVNTRVLEAARKNVTENGVDINTTVVLSDGALNVKGKFDLILSNPPLHIPRNHLVTILTQARRRLNKGGKMFLVIEDSRVQELRELLGPIIGTPKIVYKGESHEILEIG